MEQPPAGEPGAGQASSIYPPIQAIESGSAERVGSIFPTRDTGVARTRWCVELEEVLPDSMRKFRNLGDWYEQTMADDGATSETDEDGGGRLQPEDGVQGRVGEDRSAWQCVQNASCSAYERRRFVRQQVQVSK